MAKTPLEQLELEVTFSKPWRASNIPSHDRATRKRVNASLAKYAMGTFAGGVGLAALTFSVHSVLAMITLGLASLACFIAVSVAGLMLLGDLFRKD